MISPQIPYPPTAGAKIGTFNTIKYLRLKGVDITLLALTNEQNPPIGELASYCDVIPVYCDIRNSVSGIIRSLLSPLPYNVFKYIHKNVIKSIDELLSSKSFDLVQLERLHTTHYGRYIKNKYTIPVVMRLHNVESQIVGRYLQFIKNPLKREFLKMQWKRLKRYEDRNLAYFDKCVMVSEYDKDALIKRNPEIKACGIHPGYEPKDIQKQTVYPPEILFVGILDWLPNIDAITWFIQNVFPMIRRETPEVKLMVVGGNPPAKFKSEYSSSNVEITGFVDDIIPFYQRASVFIVPLRSGSGIRTKIQESLLMITPVVSTSVGAEGLNLENGRHIIIADKAKDFADAVIGLIKDKKKAGEMAENGYNFALENYDPAKTADKFIEVYNELLYNRKLTSIILDIYPAAGRSPF
ncbi:MAG: glycosyltransferase [Candidatus Marinimicrobia bacterium]|nr:glycosyltransferase [Candidatus Neomarinimicrobiota bacterium]